MEKLKKILSNNDGVGFVSICAIVLIVLMFLFAGFEFGRQMLIANNVRDVIQETTVRISTENWDNSYDGVKQGYAGAYVLNDDNWIENDEEDIETELINQLDLSYVDGKYASVDDNGNVDYYLSDFSINIVNSGLKNDSSSLEMITTARLDIPCTYNKSLVSDINLKVSSGYKNIF